MRSRAPLSGPSTPLVTIKVDAPTPDVRVQLAPPPIIWTDSDPATIAWACGMQRDAFAESVRQMLADPDLGARVMALSAKRRGVAVDDLVNYLRARHSAAPPRRAALPANDDAPSRKAAPPKGVDRILAAIGAERLSSRKQADR